MGIYTSCLENHLYLRFLKHGSWKWVSHISPMWCRQLSLTRRIQVLNKVYHDWFCHAVYWGWSDFRYEACQKCMTLPLDTPLAQTNVKLHEGSGSQTCLISLDLKRATNCRISLVSFLKNKSELLMDTLNHFEPPYQPQYGLLVFVGKLVAIFPCWQTRLEYDFDFKPA